MTCQQDIFALHYVFRCRINEALTVLANSHNNHSIRTENNQTPNQILSYYNCIAPAHTRNSDNTRELVYDAVEQPRILSDDDFEHLSAQVPPLTNDDNEGQTLYEAVREYVHLHSQ